MHAVFPCFVYNHDGDMLGGARNGKELEACQDAHPYDRLRVVSVTREQFAEMFPESAECQGHPPGPFDRETVYCDGTCRFGNAY